MIQAKAWFLLRWRSIPADDEMFVVSFGQFLTYLSGGKVVSTKHRVASPPENLVKGSARSSVVYFHSPNWNARLQPLVASKMDHNLGQAATNFHLEELIEPDGSLFYYKVLQREVEKMEKRFGK
jgi:isopenicillin N synthase-like dioxygenase